MTVMRRVYVMFLSLRDVERDDQHKAPQAHASRRISTVELGPTSWVESKLVYSLATHKTLIKNVSAKAAYKTHGRPPNSHFRIYPRATQYYGTRTDFLGGR
jgi:hypothetical protein